MKLKYLINFGMGPIEYSKDQFFFIMDDPAYSRAEFEIVGSIKGDKDV